MWLSRLRPLARHLAARWRGLAQPGPPLQAPQGAPRGPALLHTQRARALLEELEPRLLYSADNPAAWLTGAAWPAVAAPEVMVVPPAALAVVPPAATMPASTAMAATRELVFIDAGVVHTQALIDGLLAARPAGTQLDFVALQPGSDGLQQVSDELARHTAVAAVHIVAHGEQAALQLGSTRLDTATLAARSAELQTWRAALTDDADLLLYGCNVAAGETGAAFIRSLAMMTGADVGASTDATGASADGGDWELEAQTGIVTREGVATAALQRGLDGVLALSQQGGEVRVNTNATSDQSTSPFGGGSVAMDSAGNTVVLWTDMRTNAGDIYFQRFDAAGVAQGANTLVNSTVTDQQTDANVAMDGSGNFVVVWVSNNQDGSSFGVYGQRYNSAGTAQGGEFLVNTTTNNDQTKPAIAMDTSGNFTIAWTSATGDGSSNGVYAQRYNAGGVAQGGEFLVNTTTSSAQEEPVVAMTASGGFVIAWESTHSGDADVYFQRYNASGVAQGGETRANSTIAGNQDNASVANDASGNFVIVWEDANSTDGDGEGIYAQRYNASGVAQGGEFRVNTTGTNNQALPSVAMNAGGGFIVSWISNLQDGSGQGVYAQEFSASGTALGGELRVATTSSGDQQWPATAFVGSLAMVAWSGEGGGDSQGVFAQPLLSTAYNRVVVDTTSDVADADTTSITALYNDKGADGFISLREAITAANNTANAVGADRIEFDIAEPLVGAAHIITVTSALPTIDDAVILDATTEPDFAGNGGRPMVVLDGNNVVADGLRLGSNADGSTVRGLVIRDFAGDGIDIVAGSANNLIAGNYIGRLDTSGDDFGASEANTGNGIVVSGSGNIIGGSTAADRNVISGNSTGVLINGAGATGNRVLGNYIGTDAAGVLGLGNTAQGVDLAGGAAINTVGGTLAGSGNLVAFNGSAGISVTGSGSGNSLLRNGVHSNGALGIDLGAVGVTANDNGDGDTGANDLQNFPVLGSAVVSGGNTSISGTLRSNGGTTYRLEFFSSPTGDASGHGEAATWLGSGSVSTNGGGLAPINTLLTGVVVPVGHVVSATATVDLGGGNYGSTSELSAHVVSSLIGPAISVGAISGNTSEAGASASFTVVLNTAPSDDVSIPVSSSNTLEGSITSGATLVFTPANWATPQTVTISGEDDLLDDGNRAYTVVLGAATSLDGGYSGLDAADVAAFNTDDDTLNTVLVTTTADSADGDTSSLYALMGNKGADGQVSLREAITAANNTANGSGGADRIHFNIAGTGVHTINVGSVLPTVTDAVVIDGSSDDSFAANGNRPAVVLDGNDGAYNGMELGASADGSTLHALLLRDFGNSGLWVQPGSDNHTITGNYFGALDSSGQWAPGEGTAHSTLYIEGSGSTVGGTSAALRNVIAGAGHSGIWLQTGSGNVVVGNFIGLAADGSTVIGNTWDGIAILTGNNNRIGGTAAGEGNRIAGSSDDGIEVNSGLSNALLGNLIAASGSLAIDLGANDSTPLPNDPGDADNGGNNLQNHPVLATARTDGSTQLVLAGALDGAATTAYRIEFFANTAAHASGHGEAQRYLGYINVTTDGAGQAAISASLAVAVAAGESVSATATRANAGFTLFSDTSELALNVTATLAPVVTTSGGTLAFTENNAATAVDPLLTVSDGDSANLVGATVAITANYANGQDVLAFSNQLGITGSWNAGTGVLTLSGSASVANYQTALRSVTYLNTSDAPSTLYRTVAFVVNDGVAPSAAATRSVSVTAVNDAPVLTTSGSTLIVAENAAATAVDTGLTVADLDNANLVGATVTISASYVNGQDLLLFTNQLGITGSWNATTGVLTLSGATSVANYQTALRSVSYLNNSEAPDTTLRTIAFDVTDGAVTSAQATRDVQVTTVNDAPELDNSGAMLFTTIGRTNSSSPGNTVAQVIGSVGGDRIIDVDSAALEGVALTATSTNGLGAWQYSLDGGVSWTAVGAVNTNAALLLRDSDRLRFVPNGAANGQATVTFRAWDQSIGAVAARVDASAAGGTQPFSSVFETATINVVENTAGSVAVADSAQTQAAVAVPISVLSNDLDPQGDPLSVLDISNPANGTVTLGAGGVVTYTPNGGFSGSDSFNYVITDGNQGLVNYWKLDGNATDVVGGANGTLVNGPSTVPGAFGQALQFDGVDDHVALPDVAYSNEFTLSFRFRVDDNSGSEIQYFYSHGPAPSSGLQGMVHVALVESGNAVFGQRNHMITSVFDGNDLVDGNGQLLVDVASLVGDGQWHQYTATVTPGIGTQVYIDGTLRGSVNRGGDSLDATGSAYLGARSDLDPSRYLNAGSRMDSLALYNQALTSTEVGELWSGGGTLAAVTVNVNSAPVVTPSGGSATYVENAAATAVDAGLTVSDANSAQLVGATVSISSNYTAGQDQLQFSNQLGITGSWNVGTGELTLSGSASVADYQTALRSVSFVNSSDNPVTTPRVVSFVVDDGQLPSATATRNLTVTPVNDAPTAAGLNVAETYTEDTALNLIDIVISDVDHSTGTATLTLSDGAAGSLSTATSGAVTSTYNAGTGVWTASGALADVNLLLAGVSFNPALNFNGSFSIATQVSDGVAAPVTGSKAFTGVPVNDAPTAANLNAAETATEDTPLNLVDIVVSDVDSASVTATLTLSDATAGALSTGTSGAVTSTYGTGTGVWTASGARADVNALLAGLVFTPATNYTAAFNISTSISDGVAAPITGNKALVVALENDAPTATNLNAAETYTEDTPLNLTDIVVSDVDHASTTVQLTLSNPAAGGLNTGTSGAVTSSYNAGTGVWTASGLTGDVNALLAGLLFTPAPNFNAGFSISTSVDDGVAAAVTGSKAFVGVPVNDAPTASNLNAAETYTEDTPLNLVNIVVADIDSSTVTVTLTLSDRAAGALSTGTSGAVTSSYNAGTGLWLASGLIADVNTLLAGLVFTPAPNFHAAFSIGTSVDDGVAAAVTGSKAFTGVPVNDAPTASNLSAAETYTEDTPLNLVDIVASDIDSAAITARLTLSNAAAGALSTGTAGAVTSAYNAGTGVWSASGALVDVNTLLASLVFVPAADFNGAFSISTSVDDGVAPALSGNKAFTGLPVNDAPSAAGLASAEIYTEDTPLNLVDIVISDIDHSTGSATLTLSDPAVGVLSTSSAGAVTASYNAAAGVWTASGALVDLNAVLAAVTFLPSSNFNGSFSLTTSISDGVAAPVTGVKPFTAVDVNDAPTATNLNAGQTYVEDQPLDLTDVVISDLDSANVTARLTLSNPAAGTLSTGTAGAATASFNAASGVWTASGVLADVNALLAAVVFSPSPDFNASFSMATAVDDGVAAAVVGVKLMAATAVNDAPTASGLNNAELYTEDVVLNLSDLVVSDIDNATLSATLTLSDAAVGVLSTSTSGAVTAVFNAATGVWTASGAVADVNAVLAAVQFVPALNFNGAFSLATSVSDGVAAPLLGSRLFSGVAVNDAPVLAFTGSLALAEGGTQSLGAAQLQATDVDNVASQLVYTVLAAPVHGTVLLGGAALGNGGTFTQADLDAGLVAYRHDSSETTTDAFQFSLGDGLAVGATAQLPISVSPVNDEVPRITAPALAATVSLPENQTAVTRVTATDADLPAQSLSFAIAGGADAVYFSIDSSTGDLRFIQAPDYEQPLDLDRNNFYHVDLRVTDGTLSSTHSVVVAVLPENDNAPQITSGGGAAQAALEVQEGDAAVVTLTATDADRPARALTYTVVGGADAARFVVDAATGALRFVDAPLAIAPLDADRNNVYEVVVQASDGTLLVQQALRVQVLAALATDQPSTPPSTDAPPAPAPYVGTDAPIEAAAPSPLVLLDMRPADVPVAEETASWSQAKPGSRTSVLRLAERDSPRSSEALQPPTPAQQDAAEGAGGAEAAFFSDDTQSLEAALGLPSSEPDMLQVRPGGLSLAALAAQTAARSSTPVPGLLSPSTALGDDDRASEEDESVVEALATPVVAGGLAFSATLLVWATRAGGLVAAMMASVPAWRSLDPLPILERSNQPDDDDEADERADERADPSGAARSAAAQAPAPGQGNASDSLPPQAQPPGTLRDLIEPLEMLR